MQILKKIVIEVWFAIMVGSTIYLVALMSGAVTIRPTAQNIAGLFLMVGLIGLLSPLFQMEGAPFVFVVGIHFLGTFFIVTSCNFLFHWDFLAQHNLLNFIVNFFVIYLVVWVGLYMYWWLTAKQLNTKLKERRKNRE